jgi:multimeric flavodoxin WrbA
VRVVGISTTNMAAHAPRFSASEALLEAALAHARETGSPAHEIRLRELGFRACEGYYSVSSHACTWPCTITMSDPKDQLDRVYEALVHGADVVLIATPIRWGAPSSLYAKMVERMNCIQNQQTIADRVLLKNKVVAFLVIGGQDNIQAVVGQMMVFFGELGCVFPQFPFVAHSRGWSAEDMEENVREVRHSEALRAGARALVDRAVSMARTLLGSDACAATIAPGGRKGHELAPDPAP